MSYETIKQMKEELDRAVQNGEDLDQIEDRSGEWVDGYLPIYNNQIVQEWQNMPSEYDNRGHSELGMGGEIDIINLMTLDLYLYYSDLFNQALTELRQEIEEKAEELENA